MNKPKLKTVGELKSNNYKQKTLNQEITDNLRLNLSKGKNVFSDLIGYEETVVPSVERAFLSNHSICLLLKNPYSLCWLKNANSLCWLKNANSSKSKASLADSNHHPGNAAVVPRAPKGPQGLGRPGRVNS